MARSITLNNVNLTDGSLRVAHLIEIQFDTPLYLTDYGHDIVYNAITYQASSHVLKIDNPRESGKLAINSFDIELSGVSQEYIAILLSQNWINRQMSVRKAFIHNGVHDGSFLIFDGYLDEFSIKETDKRAVVSLSAASHWADFERVTGRLSNDNSQKYYFAGDNGLRYAANSTKNLKWGSK